MWHFVIQLYFINLGHQFSVKTIFSSNLINNLSTNSKSENSFLTGTRLSIHCSLINAFNFTEKKKVFEKKKIRIAKINY